MDIDIKIRDIISKEIDDLRTKLQVKIEQNLRETTSKTEQYLKTKVETPKILKTSVKPKANTQTISKSEQNIETESKINKNLNIEPTSKQSFVAEVKPD